MCCRLALSLAVIILLSSGLVAPLRAADIAPIPSVEQQPFVAATERLIESLKYIGSPLSDEESAAIRKAMQNPDARESVSAIQEVLDAHVLALVTINAESRVSAVEGPVEKQLVQQGWRTFLIKVHNEAGITPQLVVSSPQAAPVYERGKGARQRPQTDDDLVTAAESARRFLDVEQFSKQPMKENLSGLLVEYRILQLFSRDAGRREATLEFNVGQGTQDLGFRSELPLLFECVPAVEVTLGVKDADGTPTTAAFVVRDQQGRVYPNPARRLAPDFFFHNQVYRADGESILLPPGEFTATVSRGPEYLVETHEFTVPDDVANTRQAFELTRWVHPKERGWFSGDHHVHAAGCAHYDSPTEGVKPSDMMRHILGEDLNVGCVLTWGPCWYTQKQFFEGKTSDLSRDDYLMRYDIEVSGFPSSHAGHLCLLRLTEDDYPGTEYLEDWPSWTLPVLKWGKEQGGVVGYSHSGWGLALPDVMPDGTRQFTRQRRGTSAPDWKGEAAATLPDYAMPPFDGIGANEYIVTVAADVCDFISTVDTPAIWELNIWYHTLNCGFRAKISGETDFPCIYGDKVGLGRIYVKQPTDQPLDFDHWVQGVKDGRSYCGDGLSHIFDLQASGGRQSPDTSNAPSAPTRSAKPKSDAAHPPTDVGGSPRVALGEPGPTGKLSQLDLAAPGKVTVSFDATAYLEPEPTEETERIRNARLDAKPYWHLERCRIGESRKVPVEVIVNGQVAATKEIEADGSVHPLSFDLDIPQSSWIAVRILPSVHTNPIFVVVDDQPIRASRKSAQWCREAVNVCWKSKRGRIHEKERAAAKAAYDEAAATYDQIIEESHTD